MAIDQEFARRFAEDWVAAWNARDLDRVLTHYAVDFRMSSPLIRRVMGEPSGRLQGRSAVRAYWEKALAAAPDLRFELDTAYAGADSVAVHYRNRGRPAIEVLFFDSAGLVREAAAHYPG